MVNQPPVDILDEALAYCNANHENVSVVTSNSARLTGTIDFYDDTGVVITETYKNDRGGWEHGKTSVVQRQHIVAISMAASQGHAFYQWADIDQQP